MKFRAFVDIQFGDIDNGDGEHGEYNHNHSHGTVTTWSMRTEAKWGSAHSPLIYGFPGPDDNHNHYHHNRHHNNHHHTISGCATRQASSGPSSFDVSPAMLQHTPLRVRVYDQVGD